MPATPDDHLYLVDGSGFIFRAYHALPALTRKSDGMPVGAVSGFCNMIWKMLEDLKGDDQPTHVAIIFDASSVTFRNDIYPEYKAHRPEPPEDLRPQFGLIRDATRAFGLPCIEVQGYEADDIIATYARQAKASGAEVTIVSSDKDLMQLVDEEGPGRIGMADLMKSKEIGLAEVHEKFGVGPERVVDVQALAGDSVDNVPGAPGIGIKTAALLINEYGDLETLLARAEEIKQPKRREVLTTMADQIRMSRELVRLVDDVPVIESLDDLEVRDPEADQLLPFLASMEFRSLTNRIADQMGVDSPEIKAPAVVAEDEAAPVEAAPIDPEKYEWVKDEASLARWIDAIYEAGAVAVDTETTSLNEMQAELVGISLSVTAGEACYIPVGHKSGASDDLFGSDSLAEGQLSLDTVLAALRPMLEDESILKIGQNMKYDAKIFARYGVALAPYDDTMLMSYALYSGLHNHGMDALSERYLNHTPISIKSLLGSGKSAITFDRVDVVEAVKYAAEDADITLRLWQLFKPRLHRANVTTVYETLERPLAPVLAKMEMAGVQVDRDTLSRMSNAFAQKMAGLEAEIHELAGESFNVGSPAQLGDILFEKMGLEGGKKGKTGKYSTPADVLEDLATEHELPARVLDWRSLSKLKSTYTDALQNHIDPDTGRVHTSYVQTGRTQGRPA